MVFESHQDTSDILQNKTQQLTTTTTLSTKVNWKQGHSYIVLQYILLIYIYFETVWVKFYKNMQTGHSEATKVYSLLTTSFYVKYQKWLECLTITKK